MALFLFFSSQHVFSCQRGDGRNSAPSRASPIVEAPADSHGGTSYRCRIGRRLRPPIQRGGASLQPLRESQQRFAITLGLGSAREPPVTSGPGPTALGVRGALFDLDFGAESHPSIPSTSSRHGPVFVTGG
jgi:hypothetical protein